MCIIVGIVLMSLISWQKYLLTLIIDWRVVTYLNVFQKCHRAFFIDFYCCRAGISPRDHEVDRVGGLDGALPLLRNRLPVLGKLHHATRVHDSVAEGVGVVPAQGQVWSLTAFFC